MKGPFTICFNDKPVSKPIKDEKRAALGYNMFEHFAEEHGMIDDEYIEKESLSLVDADGASFKPLPDPEWNGPHRLWEAYYNERITEVREEARGAGKFIDRTDAIDLLQTYSICPEGPDPELNIFMPVTYDKEKAVEMMNFMKYGMDPSVNLFYDDPFTDDRFPITPDKLSILDADENAVSEVPESDWANGEMSDRVKTLNMDGCQIGIYNNAMGPVINDKNRAVLAYSMLKAMQENDVMMNTSGDQIRLADADIKFFEGMDQKTDVVLDPELCGSEEERADAVRGHLYHMAESSVSKHEDMETELEALATAYEKGDLKTYGVCACDSEGKAVRFLPDVIDIDKAAEMQNFVKYGLDFYGTLSVKNDKGEDVAIGGDVRIVDSDGVLYEDRYDRDWAKGQMPESISNGGMDFSEAVGSIPENDDGMEL